MQGEEWSGEVVMRHAVEQSSQEYGVEIHNVLIKSGDPLSRFQVSFIEGPDLILDGKTESENPGLGF